MKDKYILEYCGRFLGITKQLKTGINVHWETDPKYASVRSKEYLRKYLRRWPGSKLRDPVKD